MKKVFARGTTALLSAFFLLALLSFSSTSIAQRWEKLGQRQVNFKIDKDEIGVGKFEGFFTALQLKVKDGPVNMHKMVVHYRNGNSQEIELKKNFTAGSESRVIDLPGNKRVISKVVFWYDTKNFSDSKAAVELWGRH